MRFDPSSANGPKQYAPLLGSTVIEWSLSALLAEPRIEGIVVVLAADDLRFAQIAAALPGSKLATAIGGASRQESVLNGLRALAGRAAGGDWALVHDAARPPCSGPARALPLFLLRSLAPRAPSPRSPTLTEVRSPRTSDGRLPTLE